ncbi:hypothetical protein [Klebsiella pneumoniae]|uniref:hypothetical protein n=1 Tax=Klebsiella pneumoniae TaxID=573 RepID=UPI001155042E|nr:hypothetical protein [Klebsiella pneumoniae]
MYCVDCVCNEKTDNHPVDQFGYVNLAESLANGVVPSEIADSEPSYNEIDDPSTIIGKPHDVFEAYSMKDYALRAGKKPSDTNSAES